MWEENHARLDYVTWIIHPVLDDLHSSLNIGAWQDKKSGRYFWLGPLLFTLIFRLFSVYLLCCQHYSHICSCLFMSFHLLTKPYYVTIKGGDWLPGLPGGSPAAWWRRCHRRPWRPPPQLPRCGRNGRCRRRCWRRWTSPCLSESKCVCVCVFFEYFLSQASYDLACVVGLHQLPPQFCIPLECQTFGSPMMILGYRWLQTISEMTGKSAVAGSQARNTH